MASLTYSTTETGRRAAPPRTASVLGLGHYLPEEIVSNEDIGKRIGVDDEWIVRRTGIRRRRRVAPGQGVTELGIRAGRQALQDADVDPSQIDLVLVASLSQDEMTPSAAPQVAHGLGAHRAGAVDLGAACSGWLSGLALAAGMIEVGRVDTVLLIGSEALTRLADYDDRKTAALWGDGAGAVVVGCDGGGSVGPVVLAADGGLADVITCTHEERLLRVEGHETFQTAVKRLTESTVAATNRAGWELGDVDLFVYHQANARILRAVAERLDLPGDKVADYIGETGNTSAASIPLTLALLREDGRLHAGQRLLLAAIGAGFTWGAGTVHWDIP
jgi:3-oxoacyl-[acyl-carrier-protein] synthase III